MDVYDFPFEGIHKFRDAQMQSLSAKPLTIRILQMIGCGQSNLPSIWALEGILMALVATVASIITGVRMFRLKLQERRAEEEELVDCDLAIFSPVSWESSDEDDEIEPDSCSSSSSSSHLISSQAIQMIKRRKEHKEQAMDWGVKKQREHYISRESENWATARDYGMEAWDRYAELVLQEREEILNMNFRYAWELGKSKLRKWQQENLPSFAVGEPYNSLFGKENVVKVWDNLKGRALRTFYFQQGFASALDSGWMSGIASLGRNSPKGLLSLWDVDRTISLSRISANRAEIQGLHMEFSNTIITEGIDEASERTALKLWDTRMGPRPAAVNESDLLVPRRILNIKSGTLDKLYVKHNAKTVSIYDLRMFGGGLMSTWTLEDPPATEKTKIGEHNLLTDCFLAELDERKEGTWWDEDAEIISDKENASDEDEDC